MLVANDMCLKGGFHQFWIRTPERENCTVSLQQSNDLLGLKLRKKPEEIGWFWGEMDGDFGRDKEKTFWGIVTSIIRESHSFYWSINSTSYLS